MIPLTVIFAICCILTAQAAPGYDKGAEQLQGIPDLGSYSQIKYPKFDIIELGEYSKGEVPATVIKINKHEVIKEPQPYPVKIPHPYPVPYAVHKPYPVVETKIVKVPHAVPYEIVKKVPVHVEVPKPYPVPVNEHHGGGDLGHQELSGGHQDLSGGHQDLNGGQLGHQDLSGGHFGGQELSGGHYGGQELSGGHYGGQELSGGYGSSLGGYGEASHESSYGQQQLSGEYGVPGQEHGVPLSGEEYGQQQQAVSSYEASYGGGEESQSLESHGQQGWSPIDHGQQEEQH